MDKKLNGLSSFIVPIAIVAGGIMVSGAIFASQPNNETTDNGETQEEVVYESATDYIDTDILNSLGIDVEDLTEKFIEADQQFNATANLEDESSYLSGYYPIVEIDYALNSEYEVQGSPTLVINGQIATPNSRTAEGYKEIICTAFNNAPEGCATGDYDVVKSDKPVVELFVMSHCPYGKQAMSGIVPAIEELGDSVDFKLRFVYYAMHGEEEVYEQLVMYTIQENYPEKLLAYITAFLEKEGVIDSATSGSCG